MLTEDTSDAFMVIETVSCERDEVLQKCLDELGTMATAELGGTFRTEILSASCPETVIQE